MIARVFVTGATGNAGAPVVRELLRRGHRVVALARRPRRVEGCEVVAGDLTAGGRWIREVEAADAVVHLASPRGNDAASVLGADVAGTARLVGAWTRGPLVYTSSQTVYGVVRGTRMTEDLTRAPSCWYDRAKVAGEVLVALGALRRGRPAGVSLRMALLLGAGPRRNDRQFLPGVVAHCATGGAFVFDSEEALETHGSSVIGEQDFARGVVDALGITDSGPYNLTGGFVTWRALVTSVARALGVPARLAVRPGPLATGAMRLPRSRSELCPARFHRATGFAPTQELGEMVEAYVRAERDGRLDGRSGTPFAGGV